jgi:hypothetical protein
VGSPISVLAGFLFKITYMLVYSRSNVRLITFSEGHGTLDTVKMDVKIIPSAGIKQKSKTL